MSEAIQSRPAKGLCSGGKSITVQMEETQVGLVFSDVYFRVCRRYPLNRIIEDNLR